MTRRSPSMQDPLRQSRRTEAIAMGVVFALGSMGLFGCTSARNALGTNSSPCYLALPVAKEAIHDRGTFAGVRLVTAKALAARLHLLAALTARARGKLTDVCVVEYRGSYRPDQVSRPLGHAPAGGVGRFAIVVVERSTNQLLATIVRSREPEPFRHTALRAAPRAGPDLVAAQGSPGAGPLP